MRILLVEDDVLLGTSLLSALQHEGYVVDWQRTVASARLAIATTLYGLALIDRQLPDGEGLDLIASLRETDPLVGIVVLTARDAVRDRVLGLDRGADDYIVKPFDLDELLARMRAASRRLCDRAGAELRIGEVRIDTAARRVSRGGEVVELSPRAYALLLELVRCRGRVLTRGQLEDALYPAGGEVESNAVEVHVHHLRRRLGQGFVRTVRGLGYTIDADDAGV